MQQDEKLTVLRKVLGREEFRKNDELIFFCKNPHGCNGKHHVAKLSVNVKTDSFNCWVCSWKGKSLSNILKLGDRNIFLRYLDQTKRGSTDTENTKGKFTPVTLPNSFRSLTEKVNNDPYMKAAIDYCRSRGLEKSDFLKYKLGFCSEGDFRFRVIIPSFDIDGELNFFVGRKFYDHVGTSYKHGEFDKNIIFNDYMIDWNEPITLVEGPFDMMIAGDNTIPLQGTEFPDKLFSKIVTSGIKVYMALDVDAMKKQLKHTKHLMSYGIEVYHIPVKDSGHNDVGEMSKEQFRLAKEHSFRVKNNIDLLKIRASA